MFRVLQSSSSLHQDQRRFLTTLTRPRYAAPGPEDTRSSGGWASEDPPGCWLSTSWPTSPTCSEAASSSLDWSERWKLISRWEINHKLATSREFAIFISFWLQNLTFRETLTFGRVNFFLKTPRWALEILKIWSKTSSTVASVLRKEIWIVQTGILDKAFFSP